MEFTVLSQNLRCCDDPDGNSVAERAPRFEKLMRQYAPDLVGTQETSPKWYEQLCATYADEYGLCGCSRDGKDALTGERGTILYRKDRFEMLDGGDFWLSNTPDEHSRIEGSYCYRICTWAILRDRKTGREFCFANTHLDHKLEEVRIAQAELLLRHLCTRASNRPIVLTGDFNTVPLSSTYRVLTDAFADARRVTAVDDSHVQETFHGYGKTKEEIDFCFVDRASVAVKRCRVLEDRYDGYVSDHYGVLIDLELK